MSLSRETQIYHLTPDGWSEGSFYGDCFGGIKEQNNPDDRVLTIACTDKIAYVNTPPEFTDQIEWESEDKELIKELKSKYGEKPNWFGYDKM